MTGFTGVSENSVIVGSRSVFVSTALGFLAAYALRSYKLRGENLFLALCRVL